MKITQEEVVDRQTVLNIEMEDEDLGPYLDQGYRKVVQRVTIPGFRKGKAPRRVIENYLGREAILNEVLDTMLPELTTKAISEQELEIAGVPDIELVEFDPITVKATVPLTPEVSLGDFADIRIAYEEAEVSDEDIQSRLEQMAEGMTTWEPVERDAQVGDVVTLSVEGKIDGESIINESEFELLIAEDDPRPFPGFAEEIVGMEIDGTKEFTINVPDDYPDDSIASKEAEFAVTLSDLKEKVLPEIDDEFVKGLNQEDVETLDQLREKVTTDLTTEGENAAKQKHHDSVIEAFIEGATIEIPPVMIEHEINHMEQERERLFAQMNMRMDDYLTSVGSSRDAMREEFKEEALGRLTRTFALSKLSETQELEVTDEEVEAKIEELFPQSGENTPELPEINDDMRSSVRRMLVAENTVELLTSIAKGEEPELKASDEPEADDAEESEDAANTENENEPDDSDPEGDDKE